MRRASTVVRAPAQVHVPAPTGADQTAALVALLSDAPRNADVHFPSGVADYIVEGRLLQTGKQGVTVYANGTTIRATTAGAANRSHWDFVSCTDFALHDPKVEGSYTAPGVSSGVDGQQAYRIFRCVRGLIRNPYARNPWSDFFYIGDSALPSEDIVIDGVIDCLGNGRQGIAIISAKNFTADGGDQDVSSILGVARTWVDIEANVLEDVATDITVKNLTAQHRLSMLGNHGTTSIVENVTFEDIKDIPGGPGSGAFGAIRVDVRTPVSGPRRRNYTFRRCVSTVSFGTGSVGSSGGGGEVMAFQRIDGIHVFDCEQPTDSGRAMALVEGIDCTGYDTLGNGNVVTGDGIIERRAKSFELPGRVPQLWLKGDGGMWEDRARTDQAIYTGGAVAAWDDMSDNDRHAIQPITLGIDPWEWWRDNFRPNAVRVLRSLSNTTQLVAPIAASAARTLFLVAQKMTAVGASTPLLTFNDADNSKLYTAAADGSGYEWSPDQAGAPVVLGGDPTIMQTIVISVASTGAATVRVGGGAGVTFDPKDGVTTATAITLAGDHDFLELLDYTDALTLAEINTVGAQYAAFFGVPWTTAV